MEAGQGCVGWALDDPRSAPYHPAVQTITPTVADVPRLQSLMRATFTETFGHLYPPADLAIYLDRAYGTASLSAEVADPRNFWQLVLDSSGEPVAYLECVPAHLPHPEVPPKPTAKSSASTCSAVSRAKAWAES